MVTIQGFTTGSQGILMIAPVVIDSNGVATLASQPNVLNFPQRVKDLYNMSGGIDTSKHLELAILTSKQDEVGIITTALSLDASPKSISFTIDRDDIWTMMFLQRYCLSLRAGLEVASDVASTTAKEYEDGTSVRGESSEEVTISPYDTIFFVHLGPKFRDDKGKGFSKITYGLAGINSTSSNYTTAFQQDNQFTFTLTGAPQSGDANITAFDSFVFNSVVGVPLGQIGGINGLHLETSIDNGKIGAIFGDYEFWLPAKTSILQDIVAITE